LITTITFDDISPAYLTTSKLKTLINFLNTLDITCTFFVVPYGYNGYASEEFVRYLKTALDFGHELALHGYMHTKNEFGVFYPVPLPIPYPTFGRQKEYIEKGSERLLNLFGVRPEGFRAPNYLHNSNTLKALSSLGFKYDSSATIFKPTHCSRFRIRWLRNYRPFITNGIAEIPVTGDYTYNMEHYVFLDSLKIAMRDFELMRSFDGIFVINNHPDRFHETEFQLLKTLIMKIRGRTTFLRLIDAAQNLLSDLKKQSGNVK